ncbi:MAG: MobQ family relaxase [Acutalibacteraceae bacterium]
MSLFHFHVTQIKRSAGQSAVACAAYRPGQKLKSEYYGEVSDYTRKGGVVESGIMLPDYVPREYADRETLWNTVEKIEKGKKAQLAYSFDFALQNEFTLDENISLAKKFIKEQFVDRGMIADYAIHSPEKDGIQNPHVHVMCPIRPIEKNGEWGNKQKRVYELDRNGDRVTDRNGNYFFSAVPTTDWGSPETLEHWRAEWARMCNEKFEEKEIDERIDYRSYERQGVDKIPTVHEGVAVRQMESDGIKTDKGEKNRFIKSTNSLIAEIKEKIKNLKNWIDEIKSELEKFDQPETTLVDILNAYLDMRKDERNDWNKSAQTKGSVADLKKISQAIMILQSRNIQTLDKLNEILKPIDETRKSIKADEKKIKRLKQHISKIEDYEKYKPIYDKYKSIRFEKMKAKYYADHEAEIEKYKTAVRYLKANPECKPSAKAEIKSEISELTEKQKSSTVTLSTHQSELQELEQIRYIVTKALEHKENEKPSVLKHLEEAKKQTAKNNRSSHKKQEQNIE